MPFWVTNVRTSPTSKFVAMRTSPPSMFVSSASVTVTPVSTGTATPPSV
jgi:hypothetical protein